MPEIPYEIRNLHVNIIGKIGMGKSTLIAFWAWNDIKLREGGVCVIDPKGDLVDTLIRYIPEDRVDDVIYIDIDDPVPLDFMGCAPGKEDDVVADLKFMLMGSMADLAQYPNINKNVENLLYTLINANRHPELAKPSENRCTFLDVYEFLENTDRRAFILSHVSDPKLREAWKKMPSDADRDKITTRINPYLRSDTLSKIFGDPNPQLDINEVIRKKKILLIRVPVENRSSAAYGKFLMAKIQHASFSVRDPAARIPFFLYVDEFQNFPTSENFERVIDMGRGYLLCFTLSITRLKPLTESMRSALDGLGSYVVFQLNPSDASFYKPHIEKYDPNQHLRDKLEGVRLDWNLSPDDERGDRTRDKYFALQKLVSSLPEPFVTIQDALDLPKGHAIYKIGAARPVIEPTPEPGPKEPTAEQLRKIERIMQNSKTYRGSDATYSKKRTVDNGASQPTSDVVELEEDEGRTILPDRTEAQDT